MKVTIVYEDHSSVVCDTREELDEALTDKRLITSITDDENNTYTWESGL